MLTIQNVKTWYGVRFAILDEKRNVVVRDGGHLAMFPNTKDGLQQARDVLGELKTAKK